MNNNKYYMEKQLANLTNCLVGSPRANRRKIIALYKRSL